MSREPIRPFEIEPAAILTPEPSSLPAETEQRPGGGIDPDEEKPGWTGRFFAAGLIGLIGLLGLQAVNYVSGLMAENPLLGWPVLILLVVVGVSAVGLFLHEFVDLRDLGRRRRLRLEGQRLSESELHGNTDPLLKDLQNCLVRVDGGQQLAQKFEERRHDDLSDSELLTLYERTTLAPLDKKAYRHVLESARDIGILTALSPLGLLDGLLVLWRTTIMLRAVAKTYGLKLGPTASLRLLRKCLRNAAIAGLADMVTHAALEHVGASLTAMLSARAGQGAGNALLGGRLGLEAIRQTRPLPFIAEEPPKLSHIRRTIFDTKPKKEPVKETVE